MRIISFKKSTDGIIVITSKGQMKIQVFASNILRVVYTLEQEFSKKDSLIVLPQVAEEIMWDVREVAESIILSTEALKLLINKETGAFTYTDINGNILTKEPKKGGKTLAQIDVLKSVFDETTEVKADNSVDGIKVGVKNSKQVVDRKAYHTKLEFEWADDEALYGLGSHEEGIMNLRGHHQYLFQQNMKVVIPVLMSTRGYGILIDSCSCMTFHDDAYGSYIWTDVDDEMDFYFIYGPEFDQIISGYRKLTGKVPMLPRWAFGYAQSKERYKTQDELIEIVKEYRERKIPLDLIILDWKSWTGELWGQKSFDPERFPDTKEMMDQLHDMNTKLMVSIWPNMSAGGDNHKEMQENGYLLGNQSTYDAFNKKARKLYWKHANEGIFSNGVDAWWCDSTEPFDAYWGGEVKPEPEEGLRRNTEEAKKYLDPEYISAYSLLHSKGIYEGQRNTTEDKRVVNLTRSSYAGQHRYSTITWSGDISANWETLKKQIPAGLNFCATGEPYWTLDIGAFFVGGEKCWKKRCGNENASGVWFWNGNYDDGCEDLGYRELYIRWFQYGAFLPMFRSHGTDTPREVWRFGEPGDIFYDTLVKFIHLRYRLLPYIYSLAGWVTHMNYTMMRALAFDFSNDKEVLNIDDQFMFGPSIMVCPVTTPMYYEAGSQELEGIEKSRKVYLPKGCDWYDFWTGKKYDGGQTIKAEASLDTMPIFIKSGSIIPMGPVVQHTGEGLDEAWELRIYPGSDVSFNVYEDEGDGYGYEKGEYAWTTISWDDKAGCVSISERKGKFPCMPSREYKVVNVLLDSQDSKSNLQI